MKIFQIVQRIIITLTVLYILLFISSFVVNCNRPMPSLDEYASIVTDKEFDLFKETNLIGRTRNELQLVFGHPNKAATFCDIWTVNERSYQCTIKVIILFNRVLWYERLIIIG